MTAYSPALVQLIAIAQSKTAGTSLVFSPVSITVTAGNTIFVSFASDDVGTAHSCTDNLGNTYTVITSQINSGNARAYIFRAPVTTGGSITTITVSWTTNITAKAGVAAEYSGVPPKLLGNSGNNQANNSCSLYLTGATDWNTGYFFVGTCAIESEQVPTSGFLAATPDPSETGGVVGTNHTAGAGDASNIGCGQFYAYGGAAAKGVNVAVTWSSAADSAGCGLVYGYTSTPVWQRKWTRWLARGR